jgi:hypothetical protein
VGHSGLDQHGIGVETGGIEVLEVGCPGYPHHPPDLEALFLK